MERHWKFLCTGNKYCGINYEEYLQKIEKKFILGYDYDNEYALHRYGLWMQNAFKKIKRAREIGKKIQAVKVIQQKWLEYFYIPDSMYTMELAQHYQLLWAVREKMRQIRHEVFSFADNGSTILTSEQIETIRALKGKVPKYKIIRDFHINENRVNDIWENRECQQQMIPIPTILSEHSNQIKNKVLLQSRPLDDSLNYSSSNLNMTTTLSNKEIKKKSSKSRSKSVRISDPIPTNNSNIVMLTLNETEKISSEDLDALYEKEARRDEKNQANMNCLLAT
ncbi:19918_t:CDS:2, partial [Gigaspora margarita]